VFSHKYHTAIRSSTSRGSPLVDVRDGCRPFPFGRGGWGRVLNQSSKQSQKGNEGRGTDEQLRRRTGGRGSHFREAF